MPPFPFIRELRSLTGFTHAVEYDWIDTSSLTTTKIYSPPAILSKEKCGISVLIIKNIFNFFKLFILTTLPESLPR